MIEGTPQLVQEDPAQYTLTMTDMTGSVSVPLTLRIAPKPGPCANPRPATDGPEAAGLAIVVSGELNEGVTDAGRPVMTLPAASLYW